MQEENYTPMKKRILIAVVSVLLASVAVIVPVTIHANRQNQTTPPSSSTTTTTSSTTTTTTTTTETPTIPPEMHTVEEYIVMSLQTSTYRMQIDETESVTDVYLRLIDNHLTLSLPLSQLKLILPFEMSGVADEMVTYEEQENQLLLSFSSESGYLFKGENMVKMKAAMRDYLRTLWQVALPDEAFEVVTDPQDYQSGSLDMSFILAKESDHVFLSTFAVTDNNKNVTINLTPTTTHTFTVANNYADASNMVSLLEQLLLMQSQNVNVEGDINITQPDGVEYIWQLRDSCISSKGIDGDFALSGDVSLPIFDEPYSLTVLKTTDIAYICLGDILVTTSPDTISEAAIFEIVTHLIQQIMGIEQGFLGSVAPMSAVEVSESQIEMIPSFDEHGNLILTILRDGTSCEATFVGDDRGLTLTWSALDMGGGVLVAGELQLALQTTTPSTPIPEAPIVVDGDDLLDFTDVLAKTYNHYYVKGEGKLDIALGASSKWPGSKYSFISDGVHFAMTIETSMFSGITDGNASSYLPPDVIINPLLSSVTTRLYVDETYMYIDKYSKVQYTYNYFKWTTVEYREKIKMNLEDAMTNIMEVVQITLNLNPDAMEMGITTASLSDRVVRAVQLPQRSQTYVPTLSEKTSLIFNYDTNLEAYVIKGNSNGIGVLLSKYGIDASAIPADATVTLEMKAGEEGITELTMEIQTDTFIGIEISANLSYPDGLDTPILPEGLAENPDFILKTFDTP